MATELGSAYISVGLGTNNLAGEIKKAFGAADGEGGSAGKSAGGGFLKGMGGILTAAAGALAVGSFFKGAISGAANLEQSVGAVDAVFKGSADQMHGWAKTAATDVGLTQNEFNELGTLIGSQLKNGGTAMDELAPKTKDLIGVGADLASMFGGTTQDAVAALSSALKGERDPIEAYGVSLSQAKIDAEAAALGFSKVGGSLSAEANQAATLSLIMKQTADAHGNFASEADTLAHKQQVLNAQWNDGKAAIGTALLPAVSAVTGALSKALAPAMTGALAGTKELVGGFTAMGAAFKAGDGDITSSGFAGFMERVGLAAREVTGGVVAMFAAFKAGDGDITSSGFAGFMEQVGGTARQVFDALLPSIQSLLPMFASLVPQLFQLFQALSPTSLIFQALLPVLPQIAAAIGGVIQQILPLIVSLTSQLIPIITSLVTAILPPLTSIFGDIVTSIVPLIGIIASALIPIIIALMPLVVNVFNTIAEVIKSAMQAVQGIIQVVTGVISGDWARVWQGIQNIFSGVWGAIGAYLAGAMRQLGLIVSSGLSPVVNFFGGLGGQILGALGNIGGLLFSTGVNIIQGLINGIGSMMGAIGRAVISIVPEAIRGPFEQLLGIHSPSRVFLGYGQNIGQGLINGIDGMHGQIESAVTGMVSIPPVPSFGSPSYTPAFAGVAAGGGVNASFTINQVDDPIGTSHAVTRRLQSLAT